MSRRRFSPFTLLVVPVLWVAPQSGFAEEAIEVKIGAKLPYVDVTHDNQPVRVQRIQDQDNTLSGGFAKTSRKCPPFCIHPMVAAPGVTTVGELELLDFVKQHVDKGTGLLIDARTPDWYQKGTIPGSTNIPFTTFGKNDSDAELQAVLTSLGVRPYAAETKPWAQRLIRAAKGLFAAEARATPRWDFDDAKHLLLWCNGPWCDQSPRAINALLKLGYPAHKLAYYRGGMQLWQILGLTVVVPGAQL
jgi:rhodanese-related sulfurtransferase